MQEDMNAIVASEKRGDQITEVAQNVVSAPPTANEARRQPFEHMGTTSTSPPTFTLATVPAAGHALDGGVTW